MNENREEKKREKGCRLVVFQREASGSKLQAVPRAVTANEASQQCLIRFAGWWASRLGESQPNDEGP